MIKVIIGVAIAAGFLALAVSMFAQNWYKNGGLAYPNFTKIFYSHASQAQKKLLLEHFTPTTKTKSLCNKQNNNNELIASICKAPISKQKGGEIRNRS